MGSHGRNITRTPRVFKEDTIEGQVFGRGDKAESGNDGSNVCIVRAAAVRVPFRAVSGTAAYKFQNMVPEEGPSLRSVRLALTYTAPTARMFLSPGLYCRLVT